MNIYRLDKNMVKVKEKDITTLSVKKRDELNTQAEHTHIAAAAPIL